MKQSEKVKLNFTTPNNKYYLNNTENYKLSITDNANDILCKYVSLITEYMSFISEKINITKQKYYLFIFERGFDTITNVFNLLYYYTRNLDVAYYHSQKAYYFYIEFIEQISDDKHTFLQLSSRDATMFVYKKTIFEINNEYRKNIKEVNEKEKSVLSYVDLSISIYKHIIVYLMNHSDFKYQNKIEYITNCCEEIRKLNNKMKDFVIQKETIDLFSLFTSKFTNQKVDVVHFFVKIENFMKIVSNKNTICDKTEMSKQDFMSFTLDVLV